MKKSLVDKITIFGLYLFSLSLFSTKAGLDTAVTIISLGVLLAVTVGERWQKFFAERELRNFFIFSLVFLLVGTISIFSAVDKFSAVKRLVTILGYYGLLLGVLKNREMKNLSWLVNIVVAVVILESGIGLLQYFFHFDILGRTLSAPYRIMGTLSYPNDLGFALGVFLPFLFSLVLIENNFRRKMFLFFGLLLAVLALILTFTRGAWLGCFLAVGMIGLLRNRKILVGLVAVVLMTSLFPFVRERIKETSWQTESTRLYFLQHTPELIRKKLLFGWGLDNFKPVFYKYYPELPESEKGHFHPHNLYLSIAFQTGIFGFLSFVLMFYFLLVWLGKVFRKSKEPVSLIALGAIGSIIDFLVHGLVDEPWRAYQAPYVLFFVIGVAGWYWLSQGKNETSFLE